MPIKMDAALRLLWMILTIAVASPASGQLSVTPASPVSGQAVSLSIRGVASTPQITVLSVTQSAQHFTIVVDALCFGVTVPFTQQVVLGNLAAGTYTVDIAPATGACVTLSSQSLTFTVATLTALPSTSPVGLLLLVLMMAAAAGYYLRPNRPFERTPIGAPSTSRRLHGAAQRCR